MVIICQARSPMAVSLLFLCIIKALLLFWNLIWFYKFNKANYINRIIPVFMSFTMLVLMFYDEPEFPCILMICHKCTYCEEFLQSKDVVLQIKCVAFLLSQFCGEIISSKIHDLISQDGCKVCKTQVAKETCKITVYKVML